MEIYSTCHCPSPGFGKMSEPMNKKLSKPSLLFGHIWARKHGERGVPCSGAHQTLVRTIVVGCRGSRHKSQLEK